MCGWVTLKQRKMSKGFRGVDLSTMSMGGFVFPKNSKKENEKETGVDTDESSASESSIKK